MEAHLAPKQPTQVNKITTSCEIYSGPHDTQYCMEDPKQAFMEYASSRIDEAGGKWYTFKPEQNNLGDTYNPSWESHPNLRWRQPQNSKNNFSNPPNQFQPNGLIPNRPFNNNPQSFNNQSNLEGLVSNFMASQDARLSKFEADFKQQQSEMTNKIATVLKAITDRIAGAIPSDTVKNPKLTTSSVLFACSYPTEDPQCSTHIHGSINTITIHPKQQNDSRDSMAEEEEQEIKGDLEDTNTIAYIEERRDTTLLERKDITVVDNLGSNKDDEGIEWLDVEEPLDLVDTNFTILENIETKFNPKLVPLDIWETFIEIACLAINRKHGLMTFTDGTKEITFKTPYKDPERSELSSEGHDLLSSRVILSEDDYDRGCRKPSE
ncbi:hypothetical protein Tco_0178680 [Tanacetum coccineum]